MAIIEDKIRFDIEYIARIAQKLTHGEDGNA